MRVSPFEESMLCSTGDKACNFLLTFVPKISIWYWKFTFLSINTPCNFLFYWLPIDLHLHLNKDKTFVWIYLHLVKIELFKSRTEISSKVLIYDQYFHFLWSLQNKFHQTSETYHKEIVEQKWSYNPRHNVQWLPKTVRGFHFCTLLSFCPKFSY